MIKYLLIFILFTACSEKRPAQAKKEPGFSKKNDTIRCLPTDTLAVNGSFVKYIQQDTTFNILYGKGSFKKLLNFQFDCNTPSGIIPEYFSSSNDYICLIRSCGSFCTKFFFLPFADSLNSYEHDNILFFDNHQNLIVYKIDQEKGLSLIVANLLSGEKEEFVLENVLCEGISDCLDGVKIINKKISVNWKDTNGHRIERKFQISDKVWN